MGEGVVAQHTGHSLGRQPLPVHFRLPTHRAPLEAEHFSFFSWQV